MFMFANSLLSAVDTTVKQEKMKQKLKPQSDFLTKFCGVSIFCTDCKRLILFVLVKLSLFSLGFQFILIL